MALGACSMKFETIHTSIAQFQSDQVVKMLRMKLLMIVMNHECS